AVVEDVGELGRPEHGAARHGDGAQPHDAEHGHHHVRTVARHERHPVAESHAQLAQGAAALRTLAFELPGAEGLVTVVVEGMVGRALRLVGQVIDYAASRLHSPLAFPLGYEYTRWSKEAGGRPWPSSMPTPTSSKPSTRGTFSTPPSSSS